MPYLGKSNSLNFKVEQNETNSAQDFLNMVHSYTVLPRSSGRCGHAVFVDRLISIQQETSRFFGQPSQRKNKGCRNQSKRGKPSAHEQ